MRVAFEGEMGHQSAGGGVDDVVPVVGCPGVGVDGELSFGVLCEDVA